MIVRRRRPVERHQPRRLERWAEWRLGRAVRRLAEAESAPPDVAAAQSAARRALFGACAAGFVASGAIAAVEIATLPSGFSWPPENPAGMATVGAALVSFTGLELWLLFRLGLWASAKLVLALAAEAGSATAAGDRNPASYALCRAVLEIPEPDLRPFELDPAKHLRRERQLLLLIGYRLKVAASSVVAKMLRGRFLTRAGLRGYAPLVAAPITGMWALWVMRKVLREVRFRLMGRLAAAALADWAEGLPDTRPEWRRALLLLIGNRITLFGEYSLNLDALLTRLHARFGQAEAGVDALDDWPAFLATFRALDRQAQARLRQVAALLFAFKRPRLSRLERARLAELGLSEAAVAAMKERFVALDTGYLEDRAWLTEAPVAAGR